MAKKTVATLQKAGKGLTKVIKMVKSEKSGARNDKGDVIVPKSIALPLLLLMSYSLITIYPSERTL